MEKVEIKEVVMSDGSHLWELNIDSNKTYWFFSEKDAKAAKTRYDKDGDIFGEDQ